MNALERLRAVLCAPDGEVVIDGTDADRSIIAEALKELDAALSQAAGVALESKPFGHAMFNSKGACVGFRQNTGYGYNFTVADFLRADKIMPHGAPHTGCLVYAAAPAASGGEYPECSGDPASCPENEGHGCCKPNPKCSCPSGDGSLDWPCKAHPQAAASESYSKANPLGGPATMFDAIANRLRAGEPMGDVLEDYGLRFVGTSAAPVSERARDERFTAMLIGIIADVQDALGFTDEDKECSNGSLEIVAAIRELQEQALTQQRGECVGYVSVDAVKRLQKGGIHAYTFIRAERSDCFPNAVYATPQPGAEALREAIRSLLDRIRPGSEAAPWVIRELESLLGRGG